MKSSSFTFTRSLIVAGLGLGLMLSQTLLAQEKNDKIATSTQAQYIISWARAQQIISNTFKAYYRAYPDDPNTQQWINYSTQVLRNQISSQSPTPRLPVSVTLVPLNNVIAIIPSELQSTIPQVLNPDEQLGIGADVQDIRGGAPQGSIYGQDKGEGLRTAFGQGGSDKNPGGGFFGTQLPQGAGVAPGVEGSGFPGGAQGRQEITAGNMDKRTDPMIQAAFREAGLTGNPFQDGGWGKNGANPLGAGAGGKFADGIARDQQLAYNPPAGGATGSGGAGQRETPEQQREREQREASARSMTPQQQHDADVRAGRMAAYVDLNTVDSNGNRSTDHRPSAQSAVMREAYDTVMNVYGGLGSGDILNRVLAADGVLVREPIPGGGVRERLNVNVDPLSHYFGRPGGGSHSPADSGGFTGGGGRGPNPEEGAAYAPAGDGETTGRGGFDPRLLDKGAAIPAGEGESTGRGGFDPRLINGASIWNDQDNPNPGPEAAPKTK